MADYDNIVRERQKAIRRQIVDRRIAVKVIAADAGYETTSSVLSYFPANKDATPAVMSVAALFRLIETDALPLDLLSMLLPDGIAIVKVPEAIDHDEIERACRDYLAAKGRAHRQDSPAGPAIAVCEDKALRENVVTLRCAVNG
jgi:hypothetical protein